ncbi:MAG TPA: hypothetical protein VHR46_08145 [Gaiella sp.]|nr:hypothetical protein [Gaiella sp.]
MTDELLQNAERYADEFDRGGLPLPPASVSRCSRAWTRASTHTAFSVSPTATPT